VTLVGIVTEVSEEQEPKASSPIVVTLDGILIDVNAVHPANVCGGIVVMLVGRVTDTNDVAFLKTALPRDVTEDGMMIVCNNVHP